MRAACWAASTDRNASLVFEELTDLYIQTNHLRDAITQAEEMLKLNPDNVDARRMLGRIYRSECEPGLRRADGSVHSDQPPARCHHAGRRDAEAESGQRGCAPHVGPHLQIGMRAWSSKS